jgi:small subunit ribosomal protein S16
MKQMGRTHRPFFRICAMDQRSPRDGRVLEELGTYDPMVADTDARAILKADRIDYWLGVGAQPSEKVAVLIKKYGSAGSHKAKQEDALKRTAEPRAIPDPGPPASLPKPKEAPAPAAAEAESPAAEAASTEESAPVEAQSPPGEEAASEGGDAQSG